MQINDGDNYGYSESCYAKPFREYREEIEGYIQDTVDTREEEALPGMGILFEVVWKKLDTSEKNNIMDKIMQEIQTT